MRPKVTVIDRGIFDVDEYLNFIVDHARENWAFFTNRGRRDLICCFQLLARDGTEHLILPLWEDDHEKMLAIGFARGIAHDIQAVACGILHEAWMLRHENRGNWQRGESIANHSRREEILILQVLSNIRPTRDLHRWPILRSRGRATIGDEIITPGYDWATETFLDILPRVDVGTN